MLFRTFSATKQYSKDAHPGSGDQTTWKNTLPNKDMFSTFLEFRGKLHFEGQQQSWLVCLAAFSVVKGQVHQRKEYM